MLIRILKRARVLTHHRANASQVVHRLDTRQTTTIHPRTAFHLLLTRDTVLPPVITQPTTLPRRARSLRVRFIPIMGISRPKASRLHRAALILLHQQILMARPGTYLGEVMRM